MAANTAELFGDVDRPELTEYLGDKLCRSRAMLGKWRAFVSREEVPNVVDWMDDNFKLSASSSNNPGPWTTAAFQRGPTFSMADLSIRVHVEQKGSQVGATKRVTGVLGYDLAVRRRKCISWNPTLDDARDYSQSHFFSMLEDCKAVRAAMLVRDIYRRSVYNRLTRRMFRGAVIWFRTASTAQAFQRLTADTGVVDDFDRVPKEIASTSGDEDEGSVEALAEKRLRTSSAPKLILISTPTGEGESLIAARIEACTHVMRRQIKAPCCGAHQELEFGYPTSIKTGDAGNVKEPAHGLTYDHAEGLTNEKRADGCRYKCKHCDDSFTYDQLEEADAGGRWISESGLVQDDADGAFYNLETGAREFPREVGYVYSSLLSRQEEWGKVCEDYLAAVRDIEAGSYGAMKVFVNQTLAQVYRRPVIDRVEVSELLKRLEEYGAECPPAVQCIVLAIDKQHRYFDFEFVGFGARRESWGLLTGTVAGRTTDAEDESWKALSILTRKRFKKANGEQMPVNIVMIDEGDDSGNVNAWCSVSPIHRIPCKGFGTFNHELVRKRAALPDLRTGTSAHNIGVHAASEKFYDMLAIERPDPDADDYQPGAPIPGYCHFNGDPAAGYFEPPPEHDPTAAPTSNYFEQVTAAEKTIGRRSGQRAVIYITPDGVRDEKHDNRKMSLAGLEILIQNGFRLLDDYTPSDPGPGGAAPAAAATPSAAAPIAAPFTVAQAYSK